MTFSFDKGTLTPICGLPHFIVLTKELFKKVRRYCVFYYLAISIHPIHKGERKSWRRMSLQDWSVSVMKSLYSPVRMVFLAHNRKGMYTVRLILHHLCILTGGSRCGNRSANYIITTVVITVLLTRQSCVA